MRGGFSELDVSDGIFKDGQLWAWSAWLAVLADRCLTEFDFAPIRVAVDIDVGDAHFCGGNVYIAWLLFGGDVGMPKFLRSWCA